MLLKNKLQTFLNIDLKSFLYVGLRQIFLEYDPIFPIKSRLPRKNLISNLLNFLKIQK